MKPVFSIVVPVYNVAQYLRECLDSVLEQTFSNWEAVCVDDGSTDGSASILDEYSARDKRFKIIHQKNAGVSAARNRALDIIQGEWVCFLDSDDVLEKSALQKIRVIISRNPTADIVKTGLMQFEESQCILWSNSNGHDLVFDTNCVLPDQVLSGWFWQRCYKSLLVSDVRFPPLRNGEDVVFLAKCNCKAKKIVVSDCVLYGYRQRPDSASRQETSLLLVSQIMGYAYQTLVEYGNSNKEVGACYLRRLCNVATEDLATYIEQLRRAELIKAYCEALMFWHRLMRLRVIPCIQKIRLYIVAVFPFRITSLCLFVFPRKLKEKGFHR